MFSIYYLGITANWLKLTERLWIEIIMNKCLPQTHLPVRYVQRMKMVPGDEMGEISLCFAARRPVTDDNPSTANIETIHRRRFTLKTPVKSQIAPSFSTCTWLSGNAACLLVFVDLIYGGEKYLYAESDLKIKNTNLHLANIESSASLGTKGNNTCANKSWYLLWFRVTYWSGRELLVCSRVYTQGPPPWWRCPWLDPPRASAEGSVQTWLSTLFLLQRSALSWTPGRSREGGEFKKDVN